MVTILISFLFIVGFLVIALYFWQKPDKSAQSGELPEPPKPAGLFADESAQVLTLPESTSALEAERSELKERAKTGNRNVLREAQALDDQHFYDQILDLVVDSADTDSKLLALVSFLSREQLPVNETVGRAMLEWWKKSPDRSTTTKTMHVVALANDASLYNEAVLTALQFWHRGQLADTSPGELRSLFEGEFWLLSSKVRSSGAGFVLKRTLAKARRELAAESPLIQ
jgi:hypothetical protein